MRESEELAGIAQAQPELIREGARGFRRRHPRLLLALFGCRTLFQRTPHEAFRARWQPDVVDERGVVRHGVGIVEEVRACGQRLPDVPTRFND
jgi:hypothetical protein